MVWWIRTLCVAVCVDSKSDVADIWVGLVFEVVKKGMVKLGSSLNAHQSGQHHFGTNYDHRLKKVHMDILLQHP